MSTAPTPEPGPGGLRIGDAERNAAADALQQHLTSGRLTLDEYADRAAVVANARTQGEVDQMFSDLPPIPGAPGAAGLVNTTARQPASRDAGSSSPVVPASNNTRAILIGVVSAMPIIALILFFITGLWYFFLLVPLVGAIFGPMIGSRKDDDNRGQLGDGRNDR